MGGTSKRGSRSLADDRRLIALAGSLKSLEAVAKVLDRTPESVAKPAKRLSVSFKSRDILKAKRSAAAEAVLDSRD